MATMPIDVSFLAGLSRHEKCKPFKHKVGFSSFSFTYRYLKAVTTGIVPIKEIVSPLPDKPETIHYVEK